MKDLSDDREGGGQRYVDWPPALSSEPEYPELEPFRIDLASDAMIYRPTIKDDF